jgi:hypothetical protein
LDASDLAGVAGDGGADGAGVVGTATNRSGVVGLSLNGAGVRGSSSEGPGIYADNGRLLLALLVGQGPPTSGSFTVGEMVRDATGALYLRVPAAAPKYDNARPGSIGLAGSVNLMKSPFRLYDSRPGGGGVNGILGGEGPIAPGTTRDIQVTSTLPTAATTPVPLGAVALIGVVTLTNTQGAVGYLTLYPGGQAAVPPTSNVNWFGPGQDIAASFTAPLNPTTGQLRVRNGAAAPTNFILDVTGFVF